MTVTPRRELRQLAAAVLVEVDRPQRDPAALARCAVALARAVLEPAVPATVLRARPAARAKGRR